jgi:hypothetical protein
MVITAVVWHYMDLDAAYGVPMVRICYIVFLLINDKYRSLRNFSLIAKVFYGMLPIYFFTLFMILVYSCVWTIFGFNFNSDYR